MVDTWISMTNTDSCVCTSISLSQILKNKLGLKASQAAVITTVTVTTHVVIVEYSFHKAEKKPHLNISNLTSVHFFCANDMVRNDQLGTRVKKAKLISNNLIIMFISRCYFLKL